MDKEIDISDETRINYTKILEDRIPGLSTQFKKCGVFERGLKEYQLKLDKDKVNQSNEM